MRIMVYSILIVISISISRAFGFDDDRKGFLWGLGLGFGTTSYISKNIYPTLERSKKKTRAAIMNDWVIGYAPSDRLEIFIKDKYAYFGYANNMNGILALGFTRTRKAEAPTTFFTGGIGLPRAAGITASIWRIFSWNSRDYDIGAYGGYGYEFSTHFSLEAVLLYCRIRHYYEGQNYTHDYHYDNFSLGITVNFTNY